MGRIDRVSGLSLKRLEASICSGFRVFLCSSVFYFQSRRHARRRTDTDESASRPGRRDSYSVLRIA